MNNILYNIRSELKKIPSRKETLERCVKERLDSSVLQHQYSVKRVCDYINSRDSIKVLRQVKVHEKKKRRLKDDKTN